MDNIREEFEKFKNYMGPEHPHYIVDPSDVWSTHFITFKAGYKSHDEEIKHLKQDCKNLITVNKNQTTIMRSKDNHIKELYHQTCVSKEEIKKLRDALIHIEEYWNGGNESAVDAIEEARNTATEALKESE